MIASALCLYAFLSFGLILLYDFEAGQAGSSSPPSCIGEAISAANSLDAVGFARPSWADLAAGVRPEALDVGDSEPGEWRHGWQFYASDAVE